MSFQFPFDVNAGPEFDPPILRHIGVLFGQSALNCMSLRAASTALANSTNIPSPVVLTIRPRWDAMVGSTSAFLMAFSRAKLPSSSVPMRRLYPATSAASTAANRRCARSPVKIGPWTANPTRSIKARRAAFGLEPMSASGQLGSGRVRVDVRFTPKSRYGQNIPAGPFRAKPGHRRGALFFARVASDENSLREILRNTSVWRSGLVCGGMKPRCSPLRPIKAARRSRRRETGGDLQNIASAEIAHGSLSSVKGLRLNRCRSLLPISSHPPMMQCKIG
jgi:hypothetical protein